jgi:hypothetical protein
MLHFVCCRLVHVEMFKTPIYLRDVTLKSHQMWYRPVTPVYTRFLDWSISASQSVSQNSEGHVECSTKTPGCVTAMVKSLGWEPLKERRKSHRLIMMYKVVHGLVCIPESSYMVQTSDSRTRGANRLIQHHTNIAAYKQSFFPRTIQERNRLPIAVTNATKLEEFKASLLSEMALQQTA